MITLVNVSTTLGGADALPFTANLTIGVGIYTNGAPGDYALRLTWQPPREAALTVAERPLALGKEHGLFVDGLLIPLRFTGHDPHILRLTLDGVLLGELPLRAFARSVH